MFLILDTETTGIARTDQVIELAYLKIQNNLKTKLFTLEEFVERYKPTVPINPHAWEVHKISLLDLQSCKLSNTLTIPQDTKYIIAHNASFDRRLLLQSIDLGYISQIESITFIDSIKLIKSLEKLQGGTFGFENYKLTTIFKHWYPELSTWQEANQHSALGDCKMLKMVLLKAFECFPHVKDLKALFKLAKLVK